MLKLIKECTQKSQSKNMFPTTSYESRGTKQGACSEQQFQRAPNSYLKKKLISLGTFRKELRARQYSRTISPTSRIVKTKGVQAKGL